MKISDIIELSESTLPDSAEDRYWKTASADDLWALDKLILSKKLGYNCGPAGIDVPKAGDYIVRPVLNAKGLGLGAEKMHLKDDTTHLPTGTFWCEWFEGRHLSVDYIKGKQVLCVEGFKSKDTFTKWDKWIRVDEQIPLDPVIKKYFGNKPRLNVEYIGGKVIEMHFRQNEDFKGNIQEFIPVWKGQSTKAPKGYKYIKYPDLHGRIGAFVK